MKSYASLVPEGCSTTRKDGLYAEFHENGQLAHLGLYDDGVPRADTWQIFVDQEGKTARLERRFALSFTPAQAPGPALATAPAVEIDPAPTTAPAPDPDPTTAPDSAPTTAPDSAPPPAPAPDPAPTIAPDSAPAGAPAPPPDSAPTDGDAAMETWLRDKIETLGACAARKERICSFCHRGLSALHKLIDGPGVTICDGCVQLCVAILEEAKPKRRWWWPW